MTDFVIVNRKGRTGDGDLLEAWLTPQRVVEELDRYIVGQGQAKRVVAVALRNRWRRSRAPEELREEIIPKNILMMGPTGVGKTEIARRLALLVDAPFLKVEATKYTEVGYVGRDVESMIRELTEQGVRMVRERKRREVEEAAAERVEELLLDALQPVPARRGEEDEEPTQGTRLRERLRKQLRAGELEGFPIEIEVSESSPKMIEIFSNTGVEEMGLNLQDMLGNFMPKRKRKRRATVAEARRLLQGQEAEKMIDMESVTGEAVRMVEETGIVFIDELDKVCGKERAGSGPDVSREGVQRDILPIVEGSTVVTKYGPVRTNHILFIAAGAFHMSKPSDLIPELQGRFPLRVELESLGKEDFRRILTEPKNALTKQYTALLGADGVDLEFSEDGIEEMAEIACLVNDQTENIGARRLHTILEKVLEEVSFRAPDTVSGVVKVDKEFVRERLRDLVKNVDLTRYIL